MTSTDLSSNLQRLHQVNDNCKHPSQTHSDPTSQPQVPGQYNTAQPTPLTQVYQHATNPAGTAGVIGSNASIIHGGMNNNPTPQTVSSPNPEQEVTQHCPIAGCSFSSFPTNDPTLLGSCVEQIKIHLMYVHESPMSETGESSSRPSNPDKSYKEYQEATKQREVKKVKDDASRNLCEVRYFAVPLDNKILAQNMPVSTTPVNTVVDFSHLGVDVSSKDTVRKIHSRACTSFSTTKITCS